MFLTRINAILIASILTLLITNVSAQIQEGGTPLSFSENLYLTDKLPVVLLPEVDVKTLNEEDIITDQHKDIVWRFGYNHQVDLNLNNSGAWENIGKGNRVWRSQIICPSALSVNLQFSEYYLPKGAKLFIYSADKTEVIGAFTSNNNKASGTLGTTLLQGESIILEYYEPATVMGEGKLTIGTVTHGYRPFFNFPELAKGFGDSGPCNNNVVCPEGAPWQDQIQSVVIIVVNGNGACTGAMINNACGTETPYFLTADHCLGGSVANWVFRFNYNSPDCTPGSDGPTNQSVSGATLRASNGGSDFALLELSALPPDEYEAYYAGWDRSGIAPTSSVAVHHPSGDVKKISFDTDPASEASWSGAETWHIANWEDGTTEPGSSGSPLFDQNGRIIGQLYGGTANCNNNIDDYYGRLSVSWDNGGQPDNQLVDWLDACGSGTTVLDGFNPNASSAANDANVWNFVSPANGTISCDDTYSPIFMLRNKGVDSMVTANIHFQYDGGSITDTIWNGLLHTNDADSVQLPTITLSAGVHELKVWVTNPNGAIDSNNVNDTLTTSFEILDPTTYALPVSESFETGTPPTNWSINNPSGQSTWELDSTLGAYGNSLSCLKIDAFNNNEQDTRDQIILPYLNFTNVDTTAKLHFSIAYARYSNFYHDSLLVHVSKDCGITWETIYAQGNNDLSTNGQVDISNEFIPTNSEWRTDTISLANYAGEERLNIVFENYNGYGNNLYLDDINISTTTSGGGTSLMDLSTNSVILAPNPTKGNFNLMVNNNDLTETLSVNITNSFGQLIYQNTISSSVTEISLSGQASGIYFVHVTSNTITNTFKVIKE